MNPKMIKAAFTRAEQRRVAMDKAIEGVLKEVRAVLNDPTATVEYLDGSGWVITFGDAQVAPVDHVDFEELLSLDADEAAEYLTSIQE